MTSDHRAFRDKQQLYDFSSEDLILTTDECYIEHDDARHLGSSIQRMVLLYHTLGVKSSNTGDKVEKRHGARSGFDRASKL